MIQGEDTAAGPVYAETRIPNLHFGWAPLRSIRDGQYKYIDAPDPELYDLKKDPAELINLCGEFASIGMQYRRLLDSFVGKWPDRESERAGPGQVDPEALERLAALGYVRHGGTGQASLIDPKERIGAFEEYHAILNLLPEGTVTNQTLQRLDQLEIEAPEMRGVSFLRAWTCEILGDDETALSNYQVALQEDSTNPLARARYARLLARRGDLGRAEEQFEILLRLDPEDYKSRNNLAGLFHMTGRTAEAAAELEKVTSQRPSYPAAWQNLGRLYLAAGDYVRAENSCRRFIALTPANPAGHSLLSQALAGQGRQEEAAKEAAEARRLNSGPVRP
jgi:tetratricopeptide (TPR) repeat protein